MSPSEVAPVPRERPAEDAPELEVLTGFLDFLRATVLNKVAGLDDERAFEAVAPPSELTPAGVVKHLTGVERFWFSIDFAAADVPRPWTEDNPHGGFSPAPGDSLASIVADYRQECERSSKAIEHAEPGDSARGEGMAFTLRWALAHMIEETARHCGHLDLLRERIDGHTGE
ncbi:MAG: DinB family protein [Acidimicrobiales bacterium]